MLKKLSLRVALIAVMLVTSLWPIPSLNPTNAEILTQTWTSTTTTNAPSGRRGHSAVWTGTEMIVWGGQPSGILCSENTGGRFDPQTNSWTATSTTNAPSARAWHTAVWTGTEMIIWGGQDCLHGTTLNTGARYNPSTDTWTTISTSNAPSGRYDHTAVWTGTEMIVWSGDGTAAGVTAYNSGGRYNPSTDTWTTMTTTNAPSARTHALAVWTGTKMIAWGGSNDCCYPGSGSSPSGGIYDPSTNTWSTMAAGSSTAGYKFHSLDWTGTELIVWGGYQSNNSFVNTGQRYNPTTDTWTQMSTVNAPSARGYLSGIWTGTNYFVWGGYNGSTPFLNTGGLYDPVSDTWTTITTTNRPSNRDVATLVWTGEEVIIWGGFNYDGTEHFRNTGGMLELVVDTTPDPAFNEFVMIGSEGTWLKDGALVHSGDVGADLELSLPTVPSFSHGSTDITVSSGGSQNISAGNYDVLTVLENGTANLTGGTYNFESWDIRKGATLNFNAASEVRISGRLNTYTNVVIQPGTGSGIDASSIKIFVTGINGTSGTINSKPKAAHLGIDNTVHANIFTPNGTLFLREGTNATGQFLGKWTMAGEGSELTLDSGF